MPQVVRSANHALILTALQIETEAVLRHLDDLRTDQVGDTWFQTGQFGSWTVAVAEVGPGNSRAAATAVRAITHFRPKIAAFVGIAGGVKDVALGDVVVATKVYGYEAGKETPDGFRTRPDVQTSHHELEQIARVLRTKTGWRRRLDTKLKSDRKPVVYVGPIAAGEVVLSDNGGRIAKLLTDHYGDTLAVEMEGRGFLEAAHIDSTCRAVVVRGISDVLVDKAIADRQGWQKRAADTAAAFFFEMLAFQKDFQPRPRRTKPSRLDNISILPEHTESPYPGLRPFTERDAHLFFGREVYIKELIGRMARQSLISIIGPSGSGKSSIVFAGLIPALRADNWAIAAFRPGRRPFDALASTLIAPLNPSLSLASSVEETKHLGPKLRTRTISILDLLFRFQEDRFKKGLLLFVDQFEELFAFVDDEAERRDFLDCLLSVSNGQIGGRGRKIVLLFTLRADFVSQALLDRSLADALQDADVKHES